MAAKKEEGGEEEVGEEHAGESALALVDGLEGGRDRERVWEVVRSRGRWWRGGMGGMACGVAGL